MAKGCLDKLTGNLLTTCDIATVGISDLYLIYPSDVTLSMSDNNLRVSGISFASGAKSYRVEGYKQNIQVTASLLSTDYSDRVDVQIMFKIPSSTLKLWSRIISGEFYVLVVPKAMAVVFDVWGLNVPLKCTSLDYDSNANMGLATVTLSAPEGSAGNHRCYCDASIRDSIIAKSV